MIRYLIAIFVMLFATLLAALFLTPAGIVGFAFVQHWLSSFGVAVLIFALIECTKFLFQSE